MADRTDGNQCRRCRKEYGTVGQLDAHLREEHHIYRTHIFRCRSCDYTTHRRYNLRRHSDLVHERKDLRAVKYQERRTPRPEEASPPKTSAEGVLPAAEPSTSTAGIRKPLTVRIPNHQPAKPSTSTSPALSLSASPNPVQRQVDRFP